MVNSVEIKEVLEKELVADEIYVYQDGKHFRVIVVSAYFVGMNRVDRQKMVYAPLTTFIVNNCIHSVSIFTYTPVEWRGINDDDKS
ncbi:MAG: acid stress protein IbaG [Candidatus Westeberhardia cardiocondylae]|nr:acid stress protein IbaG [Candidatus Westeberhardia cardiocondylae]